MDKRLKAIKELISYRIKWFCQGNRFRIYDKLEDDTMTDNDRLKAIEERAKALGWNFGKDVTVNDIMRFFIAPNTWDFALAFMNIESGHKAAERLLSLYEEGSVVEIRWLGSKEHPEHGIFCDNFCALVPKYCRWAAPSSRERGEREPEPNCPGPGKYKLVRVEDSDVQG